MRILQVFNRYLERGGEEASVERVSDSLAERHNVFHCYFDSRQINNGAGILNKTAAAASMIWNRQSAARLRSHAHVAKPDVLLLHNLFPVGTASLLHEVGKLRIPAISFIHNFRPFSVNGYLWANNRVEPAGLRRNFLPEIFAGAWQDSRVKTALYGSILTSMHAVRLFRHIKVWIAISEFMRQRFIEAGIPGERIVTIPHCWDPMPSPPEPEDGGFYLFLGRLSMAKGVEVLFETWKILEQTLGPTAPRLIIAGEGPMAEQVRQQASKSRLIEYPGRVDGIQKAALIEGCRAMLAPSLWWEPLGLVTYEAYDFAKPMLAAASGGLTETVLHRTTGFLHEPGNARQLADQIIEIDANAILRNSIGLTGRAWLLANTNRHDWLDRFENALTLARSDMQTESRPKKHEH